jgi:hypothetical protein
MKKIKLILYLLACMVSVSVMAQGVVEYEGWEYHITDCMDSSIPQIAIYRFDAVRFEKCNGIIEQENLDETIKIDYSSNPKSDLTRDTLMAVVEVIDRAAYLKLIQKRSEYVNEELELIDQVNAVYVAFKNGTKKKPETDTERLFVRSVITLGMKSRDKVIREAAEKADKKQKYSKKLVSQIDLLVAKMDLEREQLKLFKSQVKNNVCNYLKSSVPPTCLVRDDDYPANEEWAKAVADLKTVKKMDRMPNPFLAKYASFIPNPNYIVPAEYNEVKY